MTHLTLKVAEARALNPLIRTLRLVAPDGSPLPGFTAGAHVRVQVTLDGGATDWRHYSLPELRDVLLEAGFASVDAYWEGTDATGRAGGAVALAADELR